MTATQIAEGGGLPATLAAVRGMPMPAYLVPNSLSEVERLAAKMSAAEWVPSSYKNKRTGDVDRNKVELAIMHGGTVGIPALMAPQVIAIIGNTPSVWGDGMLALVMQSGLLEDIQEFDRGEGDDTEAVCIVKRKGMKSPHECSYGVVTAKRAGLWGKDGPWTTSPRRMLKMRARAFALRDRFADVLKGLRMAEEVLDEMIDVTPLGEPGTTDYIPTERPQREQYVRPVRDIDPNPPPTERERDIPSDDAPEPEPMEAAFELATDEGEVLQWDDWADFPKAYETHLRDAVKAGYGEAFVTNNRESFLSWAANNKAQAVELDVLVDSLLKDKPAPASQGRIF